MSIGGAAMLAGAVSGARAGVSKLAFNPYIGHEAVSTLAWVFAFFFGLMFSIANIFFPNELSKAVLFLFFSLVYYAIFQSSGVRFKDSFKSSFYWFLISIFVPFGISFIIIYLPVYLVEFLTILKILCLCGPLWMSIAHRSEGKIVSVLEALLIIAVLFLLISPVWTIISAQQGFFSSVVSAEDRTILIQTFDRAKELALQIPGAIRGGISEARESASDAINRTHNYVLTGRSFEEEVDANTQSGSLGLNFRSLDFSSLQGQYKEGEEVSAWAVLEAASLDRPIPVSTFCKINPKRNPFFARTNIESFTAYTFDLRDIICTVPRGTFEGQGTHELRIFADFEYVTSGYLKRFFISQDDLTEFRLNNIDPLRYYNVNAPSFEFGRFTSGPIKLEVIKNNVLQGIDVSGTSFIVGLRIDRNLNFNREGVLKNMSLLVLGIPEGFRVVRDTAGEFSCSGVTGVEVMSQDDCEIGCRMGGSIDQRCISECRSYTNYLLTVPVTVDAENNNQPYVRTPLLVSCTVESRGNIFDSAPFIEKSFRAYAEYTYQVSIGRSFTVLRDPNYLGSSFRELPYCKSIYSHFKDESVDTASQILLASQSFIDQGNYDGTLCPQMLQAMVAFNHRSGVPTTGNIGLTGINLQRVNQVLDMPISSSEAENNNIRVTNAYLNNLLTDRCLLQNKASLDCALNHFYCGRETDCAPTRVVVGLANELAKRNP